MARVQPTRRSVVGLLFVTGFSAAVGTVAADDVKDRRKAIENDLREHFKLPKKRKFFDPRSVFGSAPDSVLCIVRKQPILAKMPKDKNDMSVPLGLVVNGEIVDKGGGGLFNQTTYRERLFRIGEQVYVVDVNMHDDGVGIILRTVEAQKDPARDYAAMMTGGLKFQLSMEEATTDSVLKAIEPFVVIADQAGNVPPPTVALGQTFAEVVAILGNPQRIVDLGAKKIYVYADMKVIFMDGKVSDVQ